MEVEVISSEMPSRYQTGALKPIIRWLSQGMRRRAAQPLPPRPAGRPRNAPVVRQGVAPGGMICFLLCMILQDQALDNICGRDDANCDVIWEAFFYGLWGGGAL